MAACRSREKRVFGGGELGESINKKDEGGNRLRRRVCKGFRRMEGQCKDEQREEDGRNIDGRC